MLNYNRSNDIRHGIILKESGEPNIGIFHGAGLPSTVDDGGVPQGSIYIRSNGELYQKSGTLNTSWVLNSAVSSGGSTASSNSQFIFGRHGECKPGKWLKFTDEIPTNDIGYVTNTAVSSLKLTVLSTIPSTGTVEIYTRNSTLPYTLQTQISLSNSTKSTITSTLTISIGDEIGARVSSGLFNDVILIGELL